MRILIFLSILTVLVCLGILVAVLAGNRSRSREHRPDDRHDLN